LLCSIVINLFILGFFKYADFLMQTVNAVFGTSIPFLNLPLPIGISFYTFQTMSYVIDVYRGDTKAQRNILQFGVYVTMFPQLIAGPILKYHQVERYLQDRRIDLDAISYGAKRFVTGLAKKVLLANNLGLLWKQVTELGTDQMSVLMAWLGIAAFALQIYFDFSGYSDMAIGLGAVLGFHFPENFNYPYVATSVKDFWHRWHISLSTWFKEYVYIPLGGNRKGLPRQLFNILVVWMLTGIWHGAGWNFLFWGLWFALFLILEKLFLGEVLESVPKVFGRVYTLAVVLISWVFFALESPGEILAYLQAMFGMNGVGPVNSLAMFLSNEYLVLLVIALVACLPLGSRLVHALKSSKTGPAMALYRLGEKVIPAVLLLLSVAYIVDASYNPFLYFRF
jgi:alginate O-acetyltransferase complex protein AlgI